jgi:predicted nucleic acid-binding Zn ribbon protein
VGIIFKGSGFYVTDNRAKSSTSVPRSKKPDKSDKPDKPDTNGETSDD